MWGSSARASRKTAWPPIGRTTGAPDGLQRVAEALRGADAVAQVVLLDALLEADGDRLEVAAGEPAVGREALGEDQHRLAALGELVVVEREPAADVAHRVLLGRHRHAVGERGHLADDVGDAAGEVAGLAALDEVGVLGEAAGVEEQRDAVEVAQRAHAAQVLQRHRLAAAGVVGDGHEDHRDVLGGEHELERVEVHVALERMLGARGPCPRRSRGRRPSRP